MQVDLPLDTIKRDWVDSVAPQIVSMFKGEDFTVEDIHDHFSQPQHWNWYGVLMARLKNMGVVERVGYKPSTRKEANGRVVSVWKVK